MNGDQICHPPQFEGVGHLFTGTVADIPDTELVRRAIQGLRKLPKTQRARTVPLWSKVSRRFGLGSTYSAQLCRRYGLNPYEQVVSL